MICFLVIEVNGVLVVFNGREWKEGENEEKGTQNEGRSRQIW